MSGMGDLWPWVTLAALGAYHGINPGMGWLFAVALGLQEKNRAAVVRAFAPIALGHALSITVVVALVMVLQTVVSATLLKYIGATALLGYGVYKLVAPMSHPRWVGMRVGFRDLTVWSFLMATAHGAGLMLVPVLLKAPMPKVDTAPKAHYAPAVYRPVNAPMEHDHGMHAHGEHTMDAAPVGHEGHDDHSQHLRQMASASGMSGPLPTALAILLHTGTMFLVMAAIAVLVYERIGLSILRKAWFNLDMLWAFALIGAGVLTLFL
jgi:hypothetical protein